MLFKLFSKLYFKLGGWKVVGDRPPFEKFIFTVAPHTSTFDFVMGKMYCSQIGVKPKVLIKKEAFFFPLGVLLKSIGGVPVDRKTNKGLAKQLIKEFDSHDRFILTVAPEGTRSLVKRWKKGFYHIATSTGVPICLGFIDHKTKTIGSGPMIHPSGDYNADLEKIKDFYRHMEGKHKEKFTVGD